MASRRNPLLRQVIALLAVGFIKLLQALPLPLARTFTKSLARIAYRLVPRLEKVGRENLRRAYGDALTTEEVDRILRGALDNMAIVAAELAHLPKVSKRNFVPEVEIVGLENLDRSRGAIFIGGHIANWEWTASCFATRGYPIAGIVRPLDAPILNRTIDSLRRSAKMDTLPKDDVANEVLKRVRDGWYIGLLIDQSPRENGVPSSFFGHPCWSTAAPALLAARAKAPIHMIGMERLEDGRYRITLHPPLELVKTRDFADDLIVNTQRTQDEVERLVRLHPEQWLWFHRRWKSRERLTQEWEARQQRQRLAEGGTS